MEGGPLYQKGQSWFRSNGILLLLLVPRLAKSGEIITSHINPEIVFKRALVLANSRDDVTIDNILSHPVWPILVCSNVFNFDFEIGL
jgi:hypothetical protein